MVRTILALSLAATMLLVGCDQAGDNNAAQGGNSENQVKPNTGSSGGEGLKSAELEVLPPGIHQQTIRRNRRSTLRFTIYIPENYAGDEPVPLIVALHFAGRVTPFFGRGILENLVQPALSELGAIIIAPDSTGGGWTNRGDEVAVKQVMDSVIDTYNIDPNKTLLTGYSMGGIGTWYLGGRNQDRFAAAIPIAGSPNTKADWKIPLYVIHSKQDQVIRLEPTAKYVKQLKEKGCDVTLVVVDGISHYETALFAESLEQAIPWIKRAWE